MTKALRAVYNTATGGPVTALVIFTTEQGTKIILDERTQTATFIAFDGAETISFRRLGELLGERL